MTDAEGVQLVVQAVYTADFDGAEGFFDRRISTLVQKNPASVRGWHVAKNRHIGEKALIDKIIMQLPLHTGIDGEINDAQKGVKERAVFPQAVLIHVVCEGGGGALVVIKEISAEIDTGGF